MEKCEEQISLEEQSDDLIKKWEQGEIRAKDLSESLINLGFNKEKIKEILKRTSSAGRSLSNQNKDDTTMTSREDGHDRNTWFELKRGINRGGQFLWQGAKNVGRGLKGVVELAVGVANEVDALALGLGAVAIVALLEPTVAPVWAMLSKNQNIGDTAKEVFQWSKKQNLARVFGYPLLALSGGMTYWQLDKALSN